MLTPKNQYSPDNDYYIQPIRTNYNEKFIKISICHKFEVEVSSIIQGDKYVINIYVSPNVEFLYKKSNGKNWKFDNIEEAWDFINAHTEFNLRILIIELEKKFSSLIFIIDRDSEYQYVYHKLMNAREALGVFRNYQEVVNQNRNCSLTLNAKFKYCLDSFGGYGHYYCFTIYQDRMIYYVNFSPKDVANFVDLNLSISKIVKTLNISVIIEISKNSLTKANQTKVDYDKPEQETARINRITSLFMFLQFLEEFS
jgi:hypothetical protein